MSRLTKQQQDRVKYLADTHRNNDDFCGYHAYLDLKCDFPELVDTEVMDEILTIWVLCEMFGRFENPIVITHRGHG